VSPGPEAITLIQGRAAEALSCGSQHCITCGDDGEPMTVVAFDPERGLALCAGESGRSSVETALVEPVEVGDRLLVHAGTAIARLEAL
jgi:bifunctional N-acetylglucosamine-1-phosphate-uridyltransferase/glucosamine-1-phosphate-acetyltransferase GlmU-like protein